MKLCAFNSLLPALYLNATVDKDLIIGSTSPGPTAMHGSVRQGILRSEPTFPFQINAKLSMTGDLVTVDPDYKWLRNNIQGMMKTDDGEYLHLSSYGIQGHTESIMRILGGDRTAPAVEHGDFYGVSIWSFLTGSEKYKVLENSIFVGSTRLDIGPEPDTFSIAFRISQVMQLPTSDCVETDKLEEKTQMLAHAEL